MVQHCWVPLQWFNMTQINHRQFHSLLKHLFRRTSKKPSNSEVLAFCETTPPVTSGFQSQKASNDKTVTTWWDHHDKVILSYKEDHVSVPCTHRTETQTLKMMNTRGFLFEQRVPHYDDVIMSTIASQITSPTIVYSTVYSGADQSKHQSAASLAFVWGIHRGPVNSPHKWPVTRKMFPFDDVIMRPI